MATSHGGPLAVALHDLQTHLRRAASGVRRVRRSRARARRRALALVRSITADDLDECAARVAVVAPRRLRHAAAADAGRVRRIARCVSDRVRRDSRHAPRPVRRRSVHRPDHPDRRSAARVRNAGQEPPAAPARELRRVPRAAVATSARWSPTRAPAFALILRRLARLDGSPADTHADLGAYAAQAPGTRRAHRRRRPGPGRQSPGVGRRRHPPVSGVSRRGRAALALHRRLETA